MNRSTAQLLTMALFALVLARLITLPLYPLIDSSEGRYSLIPLVMVQTGNWVTPSLSADFPYLAKPVLSFWLTAMSFKAFGVSEFTARLPILLLFIGLGALIYAMSVAERGRTFALGAASVFATMGYMFFLSGSVMPDVTFTFSVTLALVAFWKALSTGSRLWGYAIFVGAAAALLTKGPVGGVMIGLPLFVWLTWQREWKRAFATLPWKSGILLTIALIAPWYYLAEKANPGFLQYFIIGEHFQRFLDPKWPDRYGQGIITPMGTIIPLALIATLPWSAIALWELATKRGRSAILAPAFRQDAWLRYLVCWVVAQLFFFSLPRHVLITYAAPAVPALALLITHVLAQTWADKSRRTFVVIGMAAPVVLVLAAFVTGLMPGAGFLPSQREVIALKEKLAPGLPQPLVYVPQPPFSASFYGGARVASAPDWASLSARIAKEETFFAIATRNLPHVPAEIRAQLREIGRANDFVLFRSEKKIGATGASHGG